MPQPPSPTVTLVVDGQRRSVPFLDALQRISGALDRKDAAGAERDLRAVLGAFPAFPEGHALLGVALAAQDKLDAAIQAYREALRLKPGLARADGDLARLHLRAGDARRLAGDAEGATQQFREAARRDPRSAPAWNALGAMLVETQRHVEAKEALERAQALDPALFTAAYNLGNLALAEGDPVAAERWFRRTSELQPRYVLAHMNLSVALQAQDRLAEALAAVDQALALDPDLAPAHLNRGTVLDALNRREEAIGAYDRAYELDPGRLSALALAVHDRQMTCAWDGIEEKCRHVVAATPAPGDAVPPFVTLSLPCDPEDQRRIAEAFVRLNLPALPPREAAPGGDGPVRLAYIGADFRNHAIGHLMAEMPALHDRASFDVTIYSTGPDDGSPWRKRLEQAGDRFRDLRGHSAEAIAQAIRADDIELLVDIGGHTQRSNLPALARRPAPVQAHFLGYPGTLGAPFVDYLVADAFIAPETERAGYSEALALLPDTYQCNDRQRPRPEAAPARAELGLPDHGFVFCCFNNAFKIAPGTFDAWMRILGQVPGSVLWLLRVNQAMTRNLAREAERRGVDPARLVFAPWATMEDHLARFRAADLFLDTWPYGGHTTVSEALWMGLPVVTLPGRTFASRVAGSLLRAAGDASGIAESVADYEARAVALARDPDLHAAARARIAEAWKTAPLFDTPRFARHLERAYATMIECRRRGEKPATFAVEATD